MNKQEKQIQDMTHAEAHARLKSEIDKLDDQVTNMRVWAGWTVEDFNPRHIWPTLDDHDLRQCLTRLQEEES